MTTHYQKIQALGNRMVTNLAAKGVSAQFSDGGLTLADKILEINQFNDGVFLASDKKIAQSSNTVHLSAMVVDEGMFKVGEPVIIEDMVNTTPIYTKTKINEDPTLPDTLNDNIGSGRWALTFGSYSGSADAPFILVRTSEYDELTISKTSTGFDIESNISYEGSTDYLEGSLTGSILYYCEGELFTDTGDSLIEEWFNVNDFNMSIAQYVEGSVSLYRIYGGGITGDSGAVSGIYTCSGAGKKEIVAKSGSVVSQPYSIWDTLFYDNATSESNKWRNYSDRLTVTPSDDGTTLFRDASTSIGYYIAYDTSTSQYVTFTTPFVIEFEVSGISSRSQCGVYFSVSSDNNKTFSDMGVVNGDSVKIEYDGTTIKVYRNGGTSSTDISLSLTGNIKVGFFVGATNYFTFKNFKIYKG